VASAWCARNAPRAATPERSGVNPAVTGQSIKHYVACLGRPDNVRYNDDGVLVHDHWHTRKNETVSPEIDAPGQLCLMELVYADGRLSTVNMRDGSTREMCSMLLKACE
jgi:hypothetical protein